jgi:MFS family permease
LPRVFFAYLAVSGLFALASSSDAFLLLRANELGVAQTLIPTLWMLLNLVKAVSAYPLGEVADRFGAAPTLVLGFLWYAASYAAFALAPHGATIWLLFPLYGVFYGLTEGVGKALVAQLAPATRKAWAFGLYNGVVGLTALPAGLLTGILWRRVSGPAALWTCAVIAAVAACGLAGIAIGGRLRRVAA